MRVVFAGTPQVAADTLIHLLRRGDHEVAAVLTRPDAPQGRSARPVPSPTAIAAKAAGIEVLKPVSPRDPDLTADLLRIAPQCCVVVAYGGLIPANLLDIPRHGWLNIHYSLLPRWRGAAPVQHAILAGDPVTGVTIFRLVAALDAGPVLAQAEVPIGPEQNAGQLLSELSGLGADLLDQTLTALANGPMPGAPQPTTGVSLAPKISPAQARIDWSRSAEEIARLVRATNPAPIAWTEHSGQRLRVLAARPLKGDHQSAGELAVVDNTVLVGTGAGILELITVQPAGKREMAAGDWFRGLRSLSRLQ